MNPTEFDGEKRPEAGFGMFFENRKGIRTSPKDRSLQGNVLAVRKRQGNGGAGKKAKKQWEQ